MNDEYMTQMDELREDMEKEAKFQKFRHGLMSGIFGGGLVLTLASMNDWRQLVSAVVITVVAELILIAEG